MSNRFDQLVETVQRLLEQPTPPPAPAAAPAPEPAPAAPPMGGGGGGAMGGAGPEMGGGADSALPDAEMSDAAKKEADPVKFTESVLKKLLEVSPDMFNDFINMYSANFLKVSDKDEFKKYYHTVYTELTRLFAIQDRLKDIFKALRNGVEDVMGNKTEPDSGRGGTGKTGPAGPGVQ